MNMASQFYAPPVIHMESGYTLDFDSCGSHIPGHDFNDSNGAILNISKLKESCCSSSKYNWNMRARL